MGRRCRVCPGFDLLPCVNSSKDTALALPFAKAQDTLSSVGRERDEATEEYLHFEVTLKEFPFLSVSWKTRKWA